MPTLIEYHEGSSLSDHLVGSSGIDVLDGRNAATIDGGDGDDWLVVRTDSFTAVDGGKGTDHLVWDSYNALNLSTIAHKVDNIEGVRLGNNVCQTLTLNAADVLDVTGVDANGNHVLRITGDAGGASGVKDQVDLDLSLWTQGASSSENGVNYNVYTSNTDSTVKLWIQNGMGVI